MTSIKRACLIALIAVLTGFPTLCAVAGVKPRQNAQTATREPGAETFSADFETVWQLVRDHFHDPGLNGVNWKRVGDRYRARLGEVKTKAQFESLVNQMIGELHASHAEYVTDDDIEYYMLPAVFHQDMSGHRVEHIGVMGAQNGSEYVVAGVLEGGPAEQAGILSGDRLLSADGQPFHSAASFRGKEGTPVQIQLIRAGDAAPRTVAVTPVKQNVLRSFLDATEKSAKIVSVGGKRIGYIHLWTMANDAFRQTLDRLVEQKLHGTDALILDLRDGYGGSPWSYADVFFRPDVSWEQRTRGGPPITRYSGYGKPVVALINQGTRSAKEFFSYELKSTHRATLVGTRTAGAFLGAGSFDVGAFGMLELPVMGLKVDGKEIEGAGVVPDLAVPPNFTYTDRDSQLLAGEQAALKAIRARGESHPAAPAL